MPILNSREDMAGAFSGSTRHRTSVRRTSTQNSVPSVDQRNIDPGGTTRPRRPYFLRLLRAAITYFWTILPVKGPLKDRTSGRDEALITDTKHDEPPKDHIRRVVEHLRSQPNTTQYDETLSVLDVIITEDSSPAFSVETSKARLVELGDAPDFPPSIERSGHEEPLRFSLLHTLYWFSLKTGEYPTKLTILEGLVLSETKDYGAGGMNDVFRGTLKGRVVAVKHPRVIGTVQPSRRRQVEQIFDQHALVAFNMHIKHVLPVLGIVKDSAYNGFCMILPWTDNGDVRRYLDVLITEHGLRGQELVKTVNKWLQCIAEGLAYLHSYGVVHGDVRGANILVDNNGEVRITAFGSTALVAADDFHPGNGGSSIPWTAPELIDPAKYDLQKAATSRATDVYSFACTCVELYTGQSPFPEIREAQILHNVLKGRRPQRPSKPDEQMPDVLWQTVSRSWAQYPSQRLEMKEVALRLANL